jgi:hypothetical protein
MGSQCWNEENFSWLSVSIMAECFDDPNEVVGAYHNASPG